MASSLRQVQDVPVATDPNNPDATTVHGRRPCSIPAASIPMSNHPGKGGPSGPHAGSVSDRRHGGDGVDIVGGRRGSAARTHDLRHWQVLRSGPARPATADAVRYNCDNTGVMEDMTWTSWGADGARGNGTDSSIACQPNCAQGRQLTNPVVVHAWNAFAAE